jgi:hypothetical protein
MPKRSRVGERYLLASGEWLPGKERYQVQNYLGQGAFAAAYRVANEKGEVCFVKEYFPPSRPSEAAEIARVYGTERDVVRRIGNYEMVPRFWDAFEHEGFYYLVTDYIPGPDLETVLKSGQKPEEEVLTRWCVCLCNELAFLHSRSVVHHDLKPANIRLNEAGDPVIVDFSAAHWYRIAGETTEHLYGSDSYLAPEYAERSSEDLEAGKRMDVFAMGRILVELMVGERLSQDDIDRRHQQLYGSLLHSGKLDISFVRAVFKSVAYDPAVRYASGAELAEDITPAAPPVGRVRPQVLDFGLVEDVAAKEMVIQAYNVGGGQLRADIAADGEWLEVGTTGAITSKEAMFERNRQSVRVIAYPERIPAGSQAAGRIVFTFQNSHLQVPVLLRRPAQAAEVAVQPDSLRVNVPPGGVGSARLTFSNQGTASTRVQVMAPVDWVMRIEPDQFTLPPAGRQEVTVSMDSLILGEREIETELRWVVEGNPRPPIALRASPRRGAGLLTALTDKFRKK